MRVIRVGSSIVECLRIARMIERHGEQFINRAYTSEEIRYCQSRPQAMQHFATRWAGKEAILSLLGGRWGRGLHWTDIEIHTQRNGQLSVRFRGAAADLAIECGLIEVMLSASYCRTHAVAHAVGMGKELVDGDTE